MNLSFLRKFSIWILLTYLVLLMVFSIAMLAFGNTWEDLKDFFPYVAKEFWINPIGWAFLLTPYIMFRLFKYLFHTWKNFGPMLFLKRFSFIVLLPIAFLFSGFSFSKWYTQSEDFEYVWDHSFDNTKDTIQNRYSLDGKQRGMHFFGRRELEQPILKELLQTNTEWITLVPFGWQEHHESEEIGRREKDYSSWSGRDSSFMNKIKTFKEHGFYVMMKPHIWMGQSSGKWRSDITQTTDEGRERWCNNYSDFILHYARMSELLDVELFCIGTELQTMAKEHPAFWITLIEDVRKIYSGKLTYAANWNAEMYEVTFWDQLDYIGIQAYFPLTTKTNPSVRELKKGWKKHVNKIEALHQKYNKPILFSEIGYKSTPDSGIEPWAWANAVDGIYKKASYKTQANCYEAFFQTFWDKEWFAGVHFWEWQAGRRQNSERKNINFTPQEKPAENVMTKWFGRMGGDRLRR